MVRPGLAAAVAALIAGSSGGKAAAAVPDGSIALVGATLIDGTGAPPRRGMTVIIRGGRIDSIGKSGGKRPAAARTIDLQGRWLLPGLIDAHVHWRDLASARSALRSGVTTGRSMGVDRFADVGMARLHRSGAADVPDVIASGYHIRRRLADAFFLDFPALAGLKAGVSGPFAVAQVARSNASRGAAVIKVMATERAGMPDADFNRRMLSDAELRAAVAEASRSGLRVAAHAHTDEGARAAVLAGVRSVEHGTLIRRKTLALMRRRGTCFVPTLSFWLDMQGPGGEYDHPALAARARAMLPHARRTIREAARMGVRIAAGSDMRYDQSSPYRVADEAVELARSGLSPASALRSATSAAAECLGIGRRTGTIRPGLEADLIVVGGDPLRDLAALKDVRLVINDGAVALDRLSGGTGEQP